MNDLPYVRVGYSVNVPNKQVYYLKSSYQSLTDHELSGTFERNAMKIGTQIPLR